LQIKQASFSFLVITYNHELYIIEHLESIKYQIESYGRGYTIDILINDDCSNDKTVELIEEWIKLNKNLLNRVIIKVNEFNKGTCTSVTNLLLLIETKLFKLTAGDDIYSFENIFDAAIADEKTAFISGFPLYIENNDLKEYKFSNILILATMVVYFKKGILKQYVNFSYNNAPNMFYNLNCAKDARVIQFVQEYDVTEDWPLQLAISRCYPKYKIKYISKVLIYYRRTAGSTYIIANKRFVNDKLKIYQNLIQNRFNFFSGLRSQSRLLAFKTSNKFLSKLINIDLYIFFIESLYRSRRIFIEFFNLNLNHNLHKRHLKKIIEKADNFKKNIHTTV
jgi:glycosyltransferase involved in cell wall biosynthesis